jgi:hypothetical protein
MKRLPSLFSVFALWILLVIPAVSPVQASDITFDKNKFHHPLSIDNPYLPLVEGTTFIYEGQQDGDSTRDTVEVTHDTKTILGIETRVVLDTVYLKGVLLERTFDWYAQDDDGHVWYMGEDTTEYNPDGSVNNKEGSWEAGVNGAEAGIIMEADPKKGDTYQQEYAKGVAEDKAEVLSLNESISVPYGSFSHVLLIKETSALEPDVVDHKYYAPGIGDIKELTVKGGSEELHLVNIEKAQ